jgi:(S)-ureidoglycine aminohydrolase
MRPVDQLVHARTRVRPRYALMPLEGFPVSRLPTWPDAEVKVLASPALGAQFVQYMIDLPEGRAGDFGPGTGDIETFYYVLSGGGIVNEQAVHSGSFGLIPPRNALMVKASFAMRLIVVRKRCETAESVRMFEPLHGHESEVKKEIWGDNPHSLLQTLIPDEFRYDLAMNIFTFDPGFGLPIVETHVMEHGLYFLQGKGLYHLDGEWMEVEKDDFIWMGPYCPQSFYATGPTPSRYLYYKNVNREIPL